VYSTGFGVQGRDIRLSYTVLSLLFGLPVLGLALLLPMVAEAQIVHEREPLGPCSRKTALVISEIMYHPRPVIGLTNRLQFIEIYNSNPWDEDIGLFFIDGDISYTFPTNTVLGAKSFVVVARDPDYLKAVYGITNVVGPWLNPSTNGLSIDQGLVRLRNAQGAVLLSIEYSDAPPWPVSADGSGHSIVLVRPSYGENDYRAWGQSDVIGGSPGRDDPVSDEPLGSVVINEWMAHTDLPLRDSIELYNHGNTAVDLSGAYLSDTPDTNRYRIPNGTVIQPRGFLVFNDSVLGFSLFAEGETIFLVNSNQNRVIDAIDFKGMSNSVSAGRYPDGGPLHYALETRTFGGPNSKPKRWAVVINEIMYNPISGDVNDEYVEIYNRSGAPFNLSAWAFTNGIQFVFPANTIMPANAYWVVAKNPQHLMSIHTNLNTANTFGPYTGTLANGGERLTLSAADYDVVTISNQQVNLRLNVIASEVVYRDGGRWGFWSDGGGASLELIDPEADTYLPGNWADSDDTGESRWTDIEYTGPLGETLGEQVNGSLIIMLQGVGECLVDEVEVRANGGPNLVINGGFENGMEGWSAQGSHDFSTVENRPFAGNRSLHIRAGSRGDNQSNRILSAPLLRPIPTNAVVTLRAKARWLRGHPELLLRLHGGGAEAFGWMELPRKLGTPGAPNSRLVANAGPGIYDVKHSPILPAAGQPVVVSARAVDPQGVSYVNLVYRVEPATNYTVLTMWDDGTEGDEVADDGIYSATIPGQPDGTIVAFFIEAVDGRGVRSTFPADVFPPAGLDRCWPVDAMSRELVVRWGEIQLPGDFATYHLWITSANSNRWRIRAPMNNTELDGTFVYNNYRVIYNALPLFSGSPWHRTNATTGPTGPNRVDYEMNFPPDDQLLGATDFLLLNPGNAEISYITDLSAMAEQTSYHILRGMGLVENHRRYVHYFINGSQRSTTQQRAGNFIFEDAQQPNGDMIEQWFPDAAGGQLFKVEDWFEFGTNGFDVLAHRDADLQRRTVVIDGTPTLVPAPYRFMYRKRSVGVGNSANDYSQIFALINAVSPAENPESDKVAPAALSAVVDWEQWMRVFAVQRAVGNWDSFGWARGKNDYLYKPPVGPFAHMTWDIDYCLGLGQPADAPLFESHDSRIRAMFNTPEIVRAYWRAFADLVNGPFSNASLDPFIDAHAAALLANNVNIDLDAVQSIKNYIRDRRAFLLEQLATVVVPFAITGPAQFTTNDNLLIITGTAPIEVKTLTLNGSAYPYSWTTPTNFEMRVVLHSGTNEFRIQGLDRFGNLLSNDVQTLSVVFDGPEPQPVGSLIISELMLFAGTTGSQFVEIMNCSSNSFDLSGWRIDAINHIFPAGSIVTNRQIIVLANNAAGFRTAWPGVPIYGVFNATLPLQSTRLALVKPDLVSDTVVDVVPYEIGYPWPASTNGVSLQLIDANQDNQRPANWAVDMAARATPGVSNSVAHSLPTFIPLWLNELQVESLSGPLDNMGEAEPWVEIYNAGTEPLSLDGYYLANNFTTNLLQWPFPQGTVLAGGAHMVVWMDGEPEETDIDNLHASFRLNYAGRLALTRLNGSVPEVVDYLIWRIPYPNQCWGNYPENAPVFRGLLQDPTPGAPNMRRPVAVLINEWMASNSSVRDPADNDADDWFEIYNAETFAVDLGGFYLTDDPQEPRKYQVPSNGQYRIPAGGFLVVWADGETNQNQIGRADLHASFKLASSAGSIALYGRDGATLIDRVDYGQQVNDVSEGRYSDGATNRYFMPRVTPRAANVLTNFNSHPVFPIPTNYVTYPGTVNTYTIRATDRDLPAQTLTYAIVSAPSVSQLNQSGLYRWTVPTNQPPGDYTITLRVTDNGTPPRSDTMSFIVTVIPLPESVPVTNTASGPHLFAVAGPWQPITFAIESQPGHAYRVYYTDTLFPPRWTQLFPDFVASGTTASITDTPASASRFYRVLRVD